MTKFDFFMSISPTKDMYCFTGKKQSVTKGCYYSISLDQDESKRSKNSGESFIGKVRRAPRAQPGERVWGGWHAEKVFCYPVLLRCAPTARVSSTPCTMTESTRILKRKGLCAASFCM